MVVHFYCLIGDILLVLLSEGRKFLHISSSTETI